MTPTTKPLRRIPLEVSEELAAAIDEAAPQSRNAAIERWLWRVKPIRLAAQRIGVKQPPRRKPGRPSK